MEFGRLLNVRTQTQTEVIFIHKVSAIEQSWHSTCIVQKKLIIKPQVKKELWSILFKVPFRPVDTNSNLIWWIEFGSR